MKWLALIYQLALVGVAFTAQTGRNLSVSSNAADATQNPLLSTQIKKTLGSNGNGRPTAATKKREIPDALIDRPEEFDRFEDSKEKESLFRELAEAESGNMETSNFDEDVNEFPLYESEERKKRTADMLLGRSKRYSDTRVLNPAVIEFLTILNKGRNNINNYDPMREDDAWEATTITDEERKLLQLLEYIGWNPNRLRYLPNGPPIDHPEQLIPKIKINVPYQRRPVLKR